jgi:hypothetical protein
MRLFLTKCRSVKYIKIRFSRGKITFVDNGTNKNTCSTLDVRINMGSRGHSGLSKTYTSTDYFH